MTDTNALRQMMEEIGALKKGHFLRASGVMIMEKCADLLPDYFSFIKGVGQRGPEPEHQP